MQRMLKMSRGLYTGVNFKQKYLEKSEGKMGTQYLTLYSVNMTYNLKKSITEWESVCICICLRPRHGSLSAQCVVLDLICDLDLPINDFVPTYVLFIYCIRVRSNKMSG